MRNSLESDYDNNGGESVSLIVVVNLKLIRNIVSFTKLRVHNIVSLQSAQACMNTLMDTELAALSVSDDCWETKDISECMAGYEVIDMGTVYGLKCWLCPPMQGL